MTHCKQFLSFSPLEQGFLLDSFLNMFLGLWVWEWLQISIITISGNFRAALSCVLPGNPLKPNKFREFGKLMPRLTALICLCCFGTAVWRTELVLTSKSLFVSTYVGRLPVVMCSYQLFGKKKSVWRDHTWSWLNLRNRRQQKQDQLIDHVKCPQTEWAMTKCIHGNIKLHYGAL